MEYSEAIFQSLEGDRFSAEVNVASSMTAFIRAVERHPEFGALLRAIRERKISAMAVCKRIETLSHNQVDPEFENPHDVAIAAYLLALHRENAPIVHLACVHAAAAPQTWWTASTIAAVKAATARPNIDATESLSTGAVANEIVGAFPITYSHAGFAWRAVLGRNYTVSMEYSFVVSADEVLDLLKAAYNSAASNVRVDDPAIVGDRLLFESPVSGTIELSNG